jgi:surface protein
VFKAWGEGNEDDRIYDACTFYIDGSVRLEYGEYQNDWESYSVDLEAGAHTLKWSYSKDGSVDPNGDYFAIDNVLLTTHDDEAYACYTPSNTTLTFYYDGQRSSRTGTTYDLNTGYNTPGWEADGYNGNVTKVVFDPSFANARPTSTYDWFYEMKYLQSIAGINYLNTSEVTNMSWMFGYCWSLTEVDVSRFSTANVTSMRSMFHACYHLSSLDLSNFNTANVNNMRNMFNACGEIQSLDLSSFNTANVADMNGMFVDCALLRTVYVSDGWSTAAVTNSSNMFLNCSSLVGGRGTTYDASHTDAGYAHIDGGPGNPGYFSDKNASQRGDVDGDGNINITDVTVLIDCLLSGMTPPAAADCDQDGNVNITDVTVLIDYLLAGYW